MVAICSNMGMDKTTTRIERLAEYLISESGDNKNELARRIQRSPSMVNDLLAGRKSFGEKLARSIESNLGLPPGWLDTPSLPVPAEDGHSNASGTVPYHPTPTVADAVIMLPIMDGRARMGRGGYRPDNDSIVTTTAVSQAWFDRRIGSHLRHSVKLLTAFGDSMEPALSSGDVLFIDTSVTAPKYAAIYVVAVRDELLVKRIERSPEGDLILTSDNKAFSRFRCNPEDIEVLGVVVAAWKLKTFF